MDDTAMIADLLPEEIALPYELSKQFGYRGVKYFGFCHVEKENAGGGRVPRLLLIAEKFILLLKESGEISRMLLLTDLVRIEYLREVNKVLFVTGPSEKDWLFNWREHQSNRPTGAAQILNAIGKLWKILTEGHDDLPVGYEFTQLPDFTERPGPSAKDVFKMFLSDPEKHLPKTFASPNLADTADPDDVVTFRLRLKTPNEDLGAGICPTPNGSVAVKALARDGCLERHGVPLGTIIALGGVQIEDEDRLRQVKTHHAKMGKIDLELKMKNCEWGVMHYTDELDSQPPSEVDSDPYTYSIMSGRSGVVGTPGASKAVLIGINYEGSSVELYGARKRLDAVGGFLKGRGYSRQKILCDSKRHRQEGDIRPTKANVIKSLQWLAKGTTPADNLFLYMTGHSVNIPDTRDISGGEDGAMAPVDYELSGFLTCAEVQQNLLNFLPEGCRLFILTDFALGGTLVDLAYRIEILPGGDYEIGENTTETDTKAQVMLVTLMSTESHLPEAGLATSLFFKCFYEGTDPTLQTILDTMREHLGAEEDGAALYPHISCTKRFDARGERFSDPPKGMILVPEPTRSHVPSSRMSHAPRSLTAASSSYSNKIVRHRQKPLPPWLVGEHNGVDFLTSPLPNRRANFKIFSKKTKKSPPVDTQHRQRLIAFYRHYNPDMLHKVSSMLIQYKGQETLLFTELVELYGPEPHEIHQDELPPNWTKVQSSKGEVFYRNEADGRRQWEVPSHEGTPSEVSDLPPAPGFRPAGYYS